MNLYVAIRRWFQPYWNPKPKVVIQPKEENKETVEEDTQLIRVIRKKEPVDKLWGMGKRPKPGVYYFYHDLSKHQICAYLPRGTAFLYKGRDDERRSQLKPLLYPRLQVAYDRTHLVPYGYHGSEKNPALVIGWDPKQNRNELREFEMKMNGLNKKRDLYLMTLVERRKGFATWEYQVFDAKSLKQLDSLQLKLKCEEWQWK